MKNPPDKKASKKSLRRQQVEKTASSKRKQLTWIGAITGLIASEIGSWMGYLMVDAAFVSPAYTGITLIALFLPFSPLILLGGLIGAVTARWTSDSSSAFFNSAIAGLVIGILPGLVILFLYAIGINLVI